MQAEVLRAGIGTGIPNAEPFASGFGGVKLEGNVMGGYGSEADGDVADALKPAAGVEQLPDGMKSMLLHEGAGCCMTFERLGCASASVFCSACKQ